MESRQLGRTDGTRERGAGVAHAARPLPGGGAGDDEVVVASSAADGYELLDLGDGERLERWGPYRLRRPDPRAAGLSRRLPATDWEAADARYAGEAGRGAWARGRVPESWTIAHDDVALIVKLAPFKHTGVFPEQAAHWRWMRDAAEQAWRAGRAESPARTRAQRPEPAERVDAAQQTHAPARAGAADWPVPSGRVERAGQALRVLNLFAYTGGATVALAQAGHLVTHVDASKPALAWARDNARANGLATDAIRWIQDDAATFVAREIRRGRQYDAVLLDPPAFGRAPAGTGASGGIWRIDEHLAPLLNAVMTLLVDPAFILINDYARDADAASLAPLLRDALTAHGYGASAGHRSTAAPARAAREPRTPTTAARAPAPHVEAGRLFLQAADGRRLDTGVFARWRPHR